ncbi:MAG: hypothetical protein ACK5XN_24535, partial [Bacteroidota bacterium]
YWIKNQDVFSKANLSWSLVYRDVCRANDERTCITSIIPKSAISGGCPIISINQALHGYCFLLSSLSSIVFDFIARQKISGAHLKFFHIRQ